MLKPSHTDTMQSSKTGAGTATTRAQRYRPASDFDDATLARKREYWRTKKREQRAKLSAVNKGRNGATGVASRKSRPAGPPGDSKATVVFVPGPHSVDEHSSGTTPVQEAGPTLLNSDGSYQVSVNAASPGLFLSTSQVPEVEKGTVYLPCDGTGNWENTDSRVTLSSGQWDPCEIGQKERWFQRMKLHKVLPQFPECETDSQNNLNASGVGMKVANCLPGGSESRAFSLPKPNGTLVNSCPAQMGIQTNYSLQGPTRGGQFLSNGGSAAALTGHTVVLQTTPEQTGNSPRKFSLSVQRSATIARRLTAPDAVGNKVRIDPQCPVTNHKPGGRCTNPGQASGNAAADARTSAGSEEEKAAKRREYWRIKKREQRAKLMAKLGKARERMRSVAMSAQKSQQASCIVLERPPSAWSKEGQKQAASRVRCPLIPVSLQRAGRLLKNAKAVAVSGPSPRYPSITIKREFAHSLPCEGGLNTSESKHPAFPPKVEVLSGAPVMNRNTKTGFDPQTPKVDVRLRSAAPPSMTSPQFPRANLWHEKPQDGGLRWGVSRSRTPRQRFLEAQRMMNQRSARKSAPPLPDREESAEEKAARKREYWRIKKREQRANLSMEVKAKMKERDALMRRVKRYQCILEEMRRARTGCDKPSPPPGGSLAGDTEAIGGFIKEDGTVTTEIPESTANLRSSGPETVPGIHSFSLAPSFNKTPQVKDSCPHTVSSQPETQKLVSDKPVFHSSVKQNFNRSLPAVLQMNVSQTNPPSVQSNYPKMNLVNHPLQVNRAAEKYSVAAVEERTGLKLAPLAVAAPSQTPELSEEERMAKKREYWRIKKREQRAMRASRGKQTLSQGSVKREREREPAPTAAACTSPDPPPCPDVKPPLPPPPEQTIEPDCQAATLLAVASMKKLLEESLSTVASCNGLSPCKSEELNPKEEVADVEIKPSLSPPPAGGAEPGILPDSSPQKAQVACWQVEKEISQAEPTLPSSSPTPAPIVPCSQRQAPSRGHLVPLRRAQRLRAKRMGHHCCSPEPLKPKPGQAPVQGDEALLQKKREYWRVMKREQRARKAGRDRDMKKRYGGEEGRKLSANAAQTPMQTEEDPQWRRREYWKVRKKEQAARKGADESPEQQAPKVCIVDTENPEQKERGNVLGVPALQLQSSAPLPCALPPAGRSFTCLKAVSTLPTLLVVNPSPLSSGLPSGTPQTKPQAKADAGGTCSAALSPAGGASGNACGVDLPATVANEARLLLVQSRQDNSSDSSAEPSGVRRWRLQVQPGVNALPAPPPSDGTSSLTPPCGKMPPCVKQEEVPLQPPKPLQTPAELEEELRRKKREYWRGRKKEQRARKAARERELKREGSQRSLRPASAVVEHDPSQWFDCTEGKELSHSTSTATDPQVQPQLKQTRAVKVEAEVGILGKEPEDEEESHMDRWRAHLLMDFDPLNQLLVCMVCGELQHSHSLEGMRGHIEEAHPDTLSLEPRDRRRIQEAWDEQVLVRERFFTNQLQRQSGALTGVEMSTDNPAEVEVLVDPEDFTALKNSKSSKTKGHKKV